MYDCFSHALGQLTSTLLRLAGLGIQVRSGELDPVPPERVETYATVTSGQLIEKDEWLTRRFSHVGSTSSNSPWIYLRRLKRLS